MREVLPDCVILDLMMPVMSGPELLEIMQADPVLKNIPVIVVTALSEMDKVVYCIEHGAVDYMQKPFRAQVLRARLASCIDRKKMHDREMELTKQLEIHNAELEERVRVQVEQITAAQLSTIFAMCKLAESRDVDTGKHLERVQEICAALTRQLMINPNPDEYVPTKEFLRDIRSASALHDIGKVAVSDLVLQKPGKLTVEEFAVMKTHTTHGYRLLADVDKSHPGNNYISMGKEVALSHHERWDGNGYPNGVSGYDIPLSARIMSIADVYDALSHQRCYKPAMSHADSLKIIEEGSGKNFDPYLVELFFQIADQVEQIIIELDKPEVVEPFALVK